MRRAKRKWGGYSFMIKEDGVSFGSQKERDAYHGREVTKVSVTHGKPKLIERVRSTVPLFTDRINHLTYRDKVKYYKSLSYFYERKSKNSL